jgi:putative hydrolase of the HAD superfamily
MAIRAVLFDWGGTLVRDDRTDRREPLLAVAAYARGRLKQPIRDDELERAFSSVIGVPTSTAPEIDAILGAVFTWLGWTVGTSDVDACSRLFFESATHGQTVYDDARALLPSLRYRGYRAGVVANELFGAALLQPHVNALGLAGYLDVIVTSADTGVAKPDPGIFHYALNALRVDPAEALFVGDSRDQDITGARAAGMRAVLLDRKDRAHEAAGYLVIERLGALNELLGEGTIRE